MLIYWWLPSFRTPSMEFKAETQNDIFSLPWLLWELLLESLPLIGLLSWGNVILFSGCRKDSQWYSKGQMTVWEGSTQHREKACPVPRASDSHFHIQLLSLENVQAICNDYNLLDKDHYSWGVARKSGTPNGLPLQPLSFKNQEHTLMIFTNGLTSPNSVLFVMFIQSCFWDLCHQK